MERLTYLFKITQLGERTENWCPLPVPRNGPHPPLLRTPVDLHLVFPEYQLNARQASGRKRKDFKELKLELKGFCFQANVGAMEKKKVMAQCDTFLDRLGVILVAANLSNKEDS